MVMTQFKYVVWRQTSGGLIREIPILFPDNLVHSEVAEATERVLPLRNGSGSVPHTVKNEIVAAGFVDLTTMDCHGESESLNKKSRGIKDSSLIMLYLYTHGIVNE